MNPFLHLRTLLLLGLLFAQGVTLTVAQTNTPVAPEVPTSATVTVRGSVQIPAGAEVPEGGLDVVLLKFVVDAEGQVNTTGPVARIKSDPEGHFEFQEVPREVRAAYRVGSRVRGELISSEIFFMHPDQAVFEVNLAVPGVSEETEKLELEQTSLVLENALGELRVTEVLSLINPLRERIDTRGRPLVVRLPEDLSEFQMMEARPDQDYRLSPGKLEITRIFPQGGIQLLYQYSLPAWLGSLSFSRPLTHPPEQMSVFTAIDLLEIRSEQLEFKGKQTLGGTAFRVWNGKPGSQTSLELTVGGIPVKSQVYYVITLFTLVLLGLLAFVFYRTRLRPARRNPAP
ncbi:MAG: hypothetical protein ACO4AU_14400 [bacterium]